METCEWCEEEVEIWDKAVVAGSSKLLCKTCYNMYLDGYIDEFSTRRINWEST
jgi:hypothetical protein